MGNNTAKGMNVVHLPLQEVKVYEKNPRRNSEAVDKVAESIRQFGFQQPLVLDKDNTIIVGHTRFLAAQKLGLETVPCVIADGLTKKQIKAYRLADNKTHEFSGWDFGLLDEELKDLFDFDMAAFGFGDIDDADNERKDISDTLKEKFEVVVECKDMEHLETVYNALTSEGYECRVLTL